MNSVQPIIRFIENKDLSELIFLCKKHAEYERADYNTDNKEQLTEKHLFGKTPALYCLVVEADSAVIGYATYMKQYSTWDAEYYVYIDCLYLLDEWRGLRLGEKLIEKIKEESKILGCSLIQWQTPDFNVRAIKFYKRIGATSKNKERFFLNL